MNLQAFVAGSGFAAISLCQLSDHAPLIVDCDFALTPALFSRVN